MSNYNFNIYILNSCYLLNYKSNTELKFAVVMIVKNTSYYSGMISVTEFFKYIYSSLQYSNDFIESIFHEDAHMYFSENKI